jgi:hypothetical protein
MPPSYKKESTIPGPKPIDEFVPHWGVAYGIDVDNVKLPDIIISIEGKLTKIFPTKDVGNDKTIQNGEFETEHGPIKITFWNREVDKALRGKRVIIASTKGNKGIGGLTYDIREFESKGVDVREEGLAVSERCDITVIGAAGAPQAKSPAPQAKPAAKPPTAAPSAQETHIERDPIHETKDDLTIFHEYKDGLAFKQSQIDTAIREAHAEKGYSEETLVALVINACITADRAGIFNLNTSGLPPVAKEPPASKPTSTAPETSDVANWGPVVIPSGSHVGETLAACGKAHIIELYNHFKEVGFKTDFSKSVQQAYVDLSWAGDQSEEEAPGAEKPEPDDDDIPF